MKFGITGKSFDMILKVLSSCVEIERAMIFGSRAVGNYRKGSDIDLAIYGKKITSNLVNDISVKLNEELPLPYYFDIVHYESLDHENLKKHINTHGKLFYKRAL